MGTKLGILHESGKTEDLGEVDLQNEVCTPGADSARLAEAYGWECLFEDTDAIYASKEPESTDELKYMFVIAVTDMGNACGSECEETRYRSDLLGPTEYGTREEVVKALMAHPQREALVGAYFVNEEDNWVPTDEEVMEWAKDHVEEQDFTEILTELYVVPVSGNGTFVRRACGDEERFDSLKESFTKHGDWREAVEDIYRYGAHVQVGSWSSYMPTGEWAPRDLETAKQQALQVKMLFGFFMDRQVNAIGETGWDWLRQAGVFFAGDSVEYEKDEGGPQWYEIDEIEDGIAYLLDRDQNELQVPVEKLEVPSWIKRLQHGRDQDRDA